MPDLSTDSRCVRSSSHGCTHEGGCSMQSSPREIDPREIDPREIDPREIDPREIDPLEVCQQHFDTLEDWGRRVSVSNGTSFGIDDRSKTGSLQ